MIRSHHRAAAAPARSAAGAGALLLVGTLLAGPGVEADQARASFTVGATVAPVAELRAPAPATIRVTAADVAAGYVDLAAAAPVEIRTNAPAYLLDVAPLRAPFRAVAIAGLDAGVVVERDGGEIVQRLKGGQHPVMLRLRYRFALDPATAPGEYPWPLQLRVQPLAQ